MTAPSFFDDLGETLADVEEVRSSYITDPGNYRAKVVKIEDATSKNEEPQIIIFYEVTEGAYSGSEVRDYFTYSRDPGHVDKNGSPDYQKRLGYIKARFVDLGLPADFRGKIDRDAFTGVEVILTMTASKQINAGTGKPYVNISDVTRTDSPAVAAASAAPTIPPATDGGFFN